MWTDNLTDKIVALSATIFMLAGSFLLFAIGYAIFTSPTACG